MNEDRHAYLIMAHNEPEVLKRLLLLLDDIRNDIYIHIDKKATELSPKMISKWIEKSSLYFTHRTNVSWGGYSQINCELQLMKEASLSGYQYYHLLSGVDLPLMNQDEMHRFFSENAGTEFIRVEPFNEYYNEYKERVSYFYPFQEMIGRNSGKIPAILYYLQNRLVWIQRKMYMDRTKKWGKMLYKGTSWFSITNALVKFILEQEPWIQKNFRKCLCADEIFIHTIVMNSPFKENVQSNSLRLIDWNRGNPYIFQMSDYSQLVNSNKLFARKFSWNKDSQIIKALYDKIQEIN